LIPNFYSLYAHEFLRVACCVPRTRVADAAFNLGQTLRLAERGDESRTAIMVFPELGLSSYAIEDLLLQDALLDEVELSVAKVVEASKSLFPVLVVGAPLRVTDRLYNTAIAIHRGKILGVVPKTYLPNYGEFYEARQFCSGEEATVDTVALLDQQVPFGSRQVFTADDLPLLRLHVEICEDVWTPIPPSSFAALAGATVLVNLSASNIVIGKAAYRRQLVSQQSARCLAAYLYSSAGAGESTTDMAWDGQAIVCENGDLLVESQRFLRASHVVMADVDLERLARERMRQTSFGDSVRLHAAQLSAFRHVSFTLGVEKP